MPSRNALDIAESEPVDCGDDFDEDYPFDYTPDSASERRRIEDDTQEFVDACIDVSGDVLPHITTLNAARDMDRIREALGVEQITYYGASYGTLLGATYAELHPEHVRALLLDAALDPELGFDDTQRDIAAATEAVLEVFLDDCGSRRSCDFWSGGDPHGAFDDVMASIEDDPMPAAYYEPGTTVVPDDAMRAVQSGLYSRGSWVQLAYALVIAHRDDDGSVLLDLAYPYTEETEDGNYYEANSAYLCGDLPTDGDIDHFHDLSKEFVEAYPRVGGSTAYWSAVCAGWPEPAENLPALDAKGSGPILVVGTTVDVATPYEWSRRLADQLDGAKLLTYEGFGHTAVFAGQSSCVDDAAVRFLVDLKLPEGDCGYPD